MLSVKELFKKIDEGKTAYLFSTQYKNSDEAIERLTKILNKILEEKTIKIKKKVEKEKYVEKNGFLQKNFTKMLKEKIKEKKIKYTGEEITIGILKNTVRHYDNIIKLLRKVYEIKEENNIKEKIIITIIRKNKKEYNIIQQKI